MGFSIAIVEIIKGIENDETTNLLQNLIPLALSKN